MKKIRKYMQKIIIGLITVSLAVLTAACSSQNNSVQETVSENTEAEFSDEKVSDQESSEASEASSETDESSEISEYTEPEAGVSYPYTFTDSTGNEILLESQPSKVAVLFSSYAEIWKLAGGDIAVTVGDSVSRGFASGDAILVNDGAGLKIDMETLIAAEPDFVIVTADFSAQAEAADTLNSMGIPCAQFREESIEDYLFILNIMTDITGNKEAYDLYGSSVENEINDFLANLDSQPLPSVSYLFIRAGSGSSSTKARTAENHLACAMLDRLGAVNIADNVNELTDELSLESIVVSQPDVILIVPQGDVDAAKDYMNSVLESDGWKDLTAVQNGQVYYLDKDLYGYKPNQRWAEAYETLEQILTELSE